jgi:GNAT superfamily N-acetyltransferase
MPVTEALARVTLDLDDVRGGLALSDAVGWNQTDEDWQIFLRHGQTIGYKNGEGRLVATAAALPYGGGSGWISMVLVAPDSRHKGLATQLMDECVRRLQQRSVLPVLDATPAGAQVYGRIGFEACFDLARWEGNAPATVTPIPDDMRRDDPQANAGVARPAPVKSVSDLVRVADEEDLRDMVALDTAANGFERRFLLADFMARDTTRGWMARDGSGFAIARQGRRATQIGPLVAADEASAVSLLDAALSGASGRVFLDVAERWTGLATWLARRGFSRQRPFVRMVLGPASKVTCHDRLFVMAGPEFG